MYGEINKCIDNTIQYNTCTVYDHIVINVNAPEAPCLVK